MYEKRTAGVLKIFSLGPEGTAEAGGELRDQQTSLATEGIEEDRKEKEGSKQYTARVATRRSTT